MECLANPLGDRRTPLHLPLPVSLSFDFPPNLCFCTMSTFSTIAMIYWTILPDNCWFLPTSAMTSISASIFVRHSIIRISLVDRPLRWVLTHLSHIQLGYQSSTPYDPSSMVACCLFTILLLHLSTVVETHRNASRDIVSSMASSIVRMPTTNKHLK